LFICAIVTGIDCVCQNGKEKRWLGTIIEIISYWHKHIGIISVSIL